MSRAAPCPDCPDGGGAPPLRLGILASHAGSTMQAILDACQDGSLRAEARVVISNNSRWGALARARSGGVEAVHLSGKTHPDPADLDRAIVAALTASRVEVVVLAGYMKRLGDATLAQYRGRIVNTHPSLLPKYGGRGMYGDKPLASALAGGDDTTGATVHLVEGDYDTGRILSQAPVPIMAGDDVKTLRARVQAVERAQYVSTLQRIADGELALDGLDR